MAKKRKTFITPWGTIVPLADQWPTQEEVGKAADSVMGFFDRLADDPLKATESPAPTLATKDNIIVQKGVADIKPITDVTPATPTWAPVTTDDIWEPTDLRTTKIGEVLSDEEKRGLIDQARQRIRGEEWLSFAERNKRFQDLQKDIESWEFFGGETQLDIQRRQAERQRAEIEWRTKEAVWRKR